MYINKTFNLVHVKQMIKGGNYYYHYGVCVTLIYYLQIHLSSTSRWHRKNKKLKKKHEKKNKKQKYEPNNIH